MAEQQQQQKLFCIIVDEASLEYLKDVFKNMSVKGEDTPLHANTLVFINRNDPWSNVIQSIREQITKELNPPPVTGGNTPLN